MGYEKYFEKDSDGQECFDIDGYLSDKKQEFEEQLSKIEGQAKYIRQWVKDKRNDMKKVIQDNEKELKILFNGRSLKQQTTLTDIKSPCSVCFGKMDWIKGLEEQIKYNIDTVNTILKNSEKDFEEAKKNVKTLERYN